MKKTRSETKFTLFYGFGFGYSHNSITITNRPNIKYEIHDIIVGFFKITWAIGTE